jgi:site-specific recombinase XerD
MISKAREHTVREFLTYMKRNHCSAESISSYESTLYIFFNEKFAFNDAGVEKFILGRYNNPGTRNKVLGQLKSFAKWAVAKGVPGVSLLTLKKFSKPRTIPTTIADRDTEKFIDTLRRIDKQAWAVAVLMRTTGMRIGEVFNRINKQSRYESKGKGYLKFLGKGQKERIVPLTADGEKAFAIWVLPGHRWSVRTIRRRFVDAEKAARIKHLKPHWFRHTLATKAVNNGHSFAAVSMLLGNTEEVCQNVYGRMDERKLTSVVEDALKAVIGV